MSQQSNAAKKGAGVFNAAPTYGPAQAERLRKIADELFHKDRPSHIPVDIFDLGFQRRKRLAQAINELADEIDSAPGPVEIELVAPEFSPYTVEESRDLLYLTRTALA
jgi:hypothetical protein